MNRAEELILIRIQHNHIRLRNGRVEYYHYKNRRWYAKVPNAHPKSGRMRFMFSAGDGKRTVVYQNRLVWMIANRRPIPDDCFVDHADGDRLNDSPENLMLMEKSESHAQGQHVQQSQNLKMLCDWFEFIAIYGREPSPDEEGDDSLLFI